MDASNELAHRLQRLERSNLRWKAAAIVTTLSAVALLALLTVEGRSAPPPKGESERVQVDSRNASTNYANFCRVTGTPEEVIFEFGMNAEPYGVPKDPIPIHHVIVTNFYTAKRFLSALNTTVSRHEAAFGELETDVQKRGRQGAK